MTYPERALAVAIAVGTILGILIRAVIVVLVVFVAAVGFVFFVLWGMTRDGRQAEWRTRPQR